MGATLTILFTDAVASTELRARIGDSAFDRVQQAHLDALRGCVVVHGGREVKSIGDGLMVAFGGAADAIGCAVAMQQAIAAVLTTKQGGMALRVGLSLGDVTIDDAGDCHGMAVVEASRLCALAEPGQVLATETVRVVAGSRGGHAYRPLGAVELKGVPDPVAIVEVQWAPLEPATGIPLPPAVAITEAWPFTGRSRELERLHECLADCAAGANRTVLVSGEPGIGKSRLARELAVSAHREGAVVLFGRCEEDLAVAYQPFAEALAQHLSHVDQETTDRVLALWSGSLRRLVPQLAPRDGRDENVEQWMLLEAIVDWLALVSAEHPLVLVLDDVHWAARPTLLALLHLVRAERLTRVLTICTYRDTEVDRTHPLSEALADLRREANVERMSIRGLDAEDVAQFVERSGSAASPAWVAVVDDHTQGNPFFLGEVLRHLTESGALEETAPDRAHIDVPEGVRDVVGRRISRLSSDAGTLLSVAAVAGPQFSVEIVAQVAGVEPDAALDGFEEVLGAGLIVETGDVGHLAFAHALVRQTLEVELSTLRRVQLHRAIGYAIEARAGDDPGDDAPDLAYHFREAAAAGIDERRRAARYTGIVGEQAMDRLAWAEAADWFALASDLVPREDTSDLIQRDEMLTWWAACCGADNRLDDAIAVTKERITQALASGDDFVLVVAGPALANYHAGRQLEPDAMEMLEKSVVVDIDAVDKAGRRVLDVSGRWQPAEALDLELTRLTGLVLTKVFQIALGPNAEALLPPDWPAMFAARCEQADAAPDSGSRGSTGGLAAFALIGAPGAQRQLDLAKGASERFARLGPGRGLGPTAEVPIAVALARLGRLDELIEHAEKMREDGEQRRNPVLLVVGDTMLAAADLLRGRVEEAAARTAARMAATPEDPTTRFGVLLTSVEIARMRRQPDEAMRLVGSFEELRPDFWWARGAVAATFGDLETCESVLAAWRADGCDVPESGTRSYMLWALTEASFAARDVDAASKLYALLEPYDGELLLVALHFLPASSAFCLGLCAETIGDHHLARRHFEDALAFETEIGAETLARRTREMLALIDAR